jgi:hypothetical protein
MGEHNGHEPPSTPAGTPEPEEEPILRELERLRDGARARGGTEEFFTLLPLVSETDALAFLRTVPTGTLLEELPERAAAWRAAHPAPRMRSEDDRA